MPCLTPQGRAARTGNEVLHVAGRHAELLGRVGGFLAALAQLHGEPQSTGGTADRLLIHHAVGRTPQLIRGVHRRDARAHAVVARVKKAMAFVRAEDIILAPDCGMKYLPRDVADGKMRSMVEAAKILRSENEPRRPR